MGIISRTFHVEKELNILSFITLKVMTKHLKYTPKAYL
jgi:hypothetical protein